ncbi:class III phosphatidylinositol 3-phosphate kinase [Trypanosoma rangeli]|uniref:phosphatidylinositol 3-kinase n=1 Tax=Trypanosoma rangeli TaxID=5698 RepID=A0A422NWR9_TRYRA|nr:class III phosphatidylinositol 3-phosphate kinase [Trypanosoma rangeli]RNF09908.1 class III phosphatidylinositol 3-phosphate kinase [Trypanosoma rangeli]|eukprot:RNF09908.1 class III phosphatidylinositol 3-phosphate kinase [Trypanosoma rangeli]
MTSNESNVVHILREKKHYDAFHWVPPSNEFIAASDVTDYFMIYLHTIGGWCPRRNQYDEDEGKEVEGIEIPLEADGGKPGVEVDLCDESQWRRWRSCGGVETIFVTLQMLHMDQPITPLQQSSHTRSDTRTFDEWIIFPIAVCDVPLDAVVQCRVYSRQGLVGCKNFHLFTAGGRLKTGPRCYKLHADGAANPHKTPTPRWELLARDLRDGLMQSVPWMDTLVEQRLTAMQEAQVDASHTVLASENTSLTLSLLFPLVRSRLPVFHLSVPQNTMPTMPPSIPFATTPTQPFLDICMEDENLCEAKAHALYKSLFLISDADAEAQPGPVERRQLQEILHKPLIHLEGLKVDDEMLLWRFRFFLARDPAYFVPFMRCVNWHNEAEQQEALKVMQQWKPISFSQALVCISFYFREVEHMRRHAISLLSRQSDGYLLHFLLQLVQGVRYDVQDELEQFLVRRALGCWEMCSTLFWHVHVETLLEKSATTDSHHSQGRQRYADFLQHLLNTLEEAKPHFLQRLRRQMKFMGVLRGLYRTIVKGSQDRVRRMEIATTLIDANKCGISELFLSSTESRSGNTVTLPTHPCFSVEHINSSGFYLFKSAKMPMKVSFIVHVDDGNNNDVGGGAFHDAPKTTGSSGPSFIPLAILSSDVGIMFKSGDDVRQDQLVVQLVQLIDGMLRQDGLDLCLSPYRVLATGLAEGLVELVPNAVTLQSVQRDIAGYIRSHNETAKDYEAAICRFTKSFAGYCVLTFILGIGDRHLENLLLTHDGRLLHIDFGYILGNDPKPFPPPMKINKEMVETLGGPQSERYAEFKSYCCSSYNIIRKHAPLILSMFLLMVDASIPQISGDGKMDPRVNLLKVQDKLRLDLSNAQAAQYITNVIADSVGSIFTNLWDVIHVAAQATRH